ncbi:Fic family protein [Alcanivorax sp.]|uniref:Fic family protein n=1 Tax=Alcanivorax sp. TaxID=1872427 RepID=UPI0026255756|nr:Fic family protein [Alcanivorax sp.]|tara:strand:+ start:1451 stop:2599 length:1149 start_codon:yes stop_codon:yes gene_type:complete
MSNVDVDFPLRLVSPDFDSPLTDTLMELNHLRRLKLGGTTAPWMFFQLKNIFHILESIGSARIEGNRTTISEYIEQKIEHGERSNERFSEIANVEKAMEFIEEQIDEGTEITHVFIRELHNLVVDELSEEGDKTPGAYRKWNVQIQDAMHVPPEAHSVQPYMDELIAFINRDDPSKYDLLKTAIAHHRFTWIHPFGNGNGRVVRLLTYSLLIKYGFNVKSGKILNPTAVFCNDRDVYYERLAEADIGTDAALLNWCDYVLSGVLGEVTKLNKLLDFDFLLERILLPTLLKSEERRHITRAESRILQAGVRKQSFKAGDINKSFDGLDARQRTHKIAKMKDAGLIKPLKPGGRTYHVSFMNNFLMRSLIQVLESEDFIPPIDR